MSNAWKDGSSRKWREVIRPAILARDNYACQIALPGTWKTTRGAIAKCLGTANSVHHIHGKAACAGCARDEYEHLQAACMPCNLKVGDPSKDKAQPKLLRIADLYKAHIDGVTEGHADRATEAVTDWLVKHGFRPSDPDDRGSEISDEVHTLLVIAALRSQRVTEAFGDEAFQD